MSDSVFRSHRVFTPAFKEAGVGDSALNSSTRCLYSLIRAPLHCIFEDRAARDGRQGQVLRVRAEERAALTAAPFRAEAGDAKKG